MVHLLIIDRWISSLQRNNVAVIKPSTKQATVGGGGGPRESTATTISDLNSGDIKVRASGDGLEKMKDVH